MPALNVEFSDEEYSIMRAVGHDVGALMPAFTKQAILNEAHGRDGRGGALADELAERAAGLNRRLM